jgi:hypothetical protein
MVKESLGSALILCGGPLSRNADKKSINQVLRLTIYCTLDFGVLIRANRTWSSIQSLLAD